MILVLLLTKFFEDILSVAEIFAFPSFSTVLGNVRLGHSLLPYFFCCLKFKSLELF